MKTTSVVGLGVGGLGMFLCCSSLSAATLLSNGSFEQGEAGWEVTGYVQGFPGGTDGALAITIGAFDVPFSSIAQQVMLVQGGVYRLSLDWRPWANGTQGIEGALRVTAIDLQSGVLGQTTVLGTSTSAAPTDSMGYHSEQLEFIVPSGSRDIVILIEDRTADGGIGVDMVVDHVQLSALINPTLQNGSFEHLDTLAGMYPSPLDWSVEGYVSILGPDWLGLGIPVGTEGTNALSIGSFDVPNTTVFQAFGVTPGESYRCSLAWRAWANGMEGLTGVLGLTVGDASTGTLLASQTWTNVANNVDLAGGAGFVTAEVDFRVPAETEAIVLRLSDRSPNGGLGLDLLVDDVVVSPSLQPELQITPTGGGFENSVTVSLETRVPFAEIRFTLDGSEPLAGSWLYQDPIVLEDTATVRARLFINGFPVSDVVSADFSIYSIPDIAFSPPSTLFTNQISVALANNVGAGDVRFTRDGSAPQGASPAYESPIVITETTTLTAQAFFNSYPISDVFAETYSRVYAFGDDGVPFSWREQHFGQGFLTDPRAAADADPDGDGYTNWEEYSVGTDPTDETSAPGIVTTIHLVPRLTFTTLPGKTYRILRAASAQQPDWEVIVEPFTATSTNTVFVDADPPVGAYYSIELSP